MCTLTYLPTGKNTFLWTQNRDESPLRTSPGLVQHPNIKATYPKEPLSGGTWIGISQEDKVVSLLNGAFEQLPYVPSTKRSRGLVVLDYLESPSFDIFLKESNFEELEPFTMVVYERGDLLELRWDKTKTHQKKLDIQQPYIWSSSTLYPANIKTLRKDWFRAYLNANPIATVENVLDFHQHAGVGDIQNDLIMDRGVVKTVSITQIQHNQQDLKMSYIDLVNGGETFFEYLL